MGSWTRYGASLFSSQEASSDRDFSSNLLSWRRVLILSVFSRASISFQFVPQTSRRSPTILNGTAQAREFLALMLYYTSFVKIFLSLKKIHTQNPLYWLKNNCLNLWPYITTSRNVYPLVLHATSSVLVITLSYCSTRDVQRVPYCDFQRSITSLGFFFTQLPASILFFSSLFTQLPALISLFLYFCLIL